MWWKELDSAYETICEGYRGISVDQSPHVKNVSAPQLAHPGLSIRNVKLGTAEPSVAADSLAGNVQFGNPYEQEEVIEGAINKKDVCAMIDELSKTLNDSNPTDRAALLVLGQLKTRIKK